MHEVHFTRGVAFVTKLSIVFFRNYSFVIIKIPRRLRLGARTFMIEHTVTHPNYLSLRKLTWFSIINISTMGNGNTKNDKTVIFDKTNGTVITDSISPPVYSIRTKGLSVNSRIGRSVNILLKPLQNHSPDTWVKFRHLFVSFF